MKSVFLLSALTFALIFGGLVVASHFLGRALPPSEPSAVAGGVESPETPAEAALPMAGCTGAWSDSEQLAAQRQALAVQEKSLAEARAQLVASATQLADARTRYTAAQERSAQKLAKMYEAMKPAKAAPILASLEMDIVLDILSRMKERQAARILAHMEAEYAAKISAQLRAQGVG
jgi:flagellar motility protein MotE (MotC chaperone)